MTPATIPDGIVVEVEHEVDVAVSRPLVELPRVLEVASTVDLRPAAARR